MTFVQGIIEGGKTAYGMRPFSSVERKCRVQEHVKSPSPAIHYDFPHIYHTYLPHTTKHETHIDLMSGRPSLGGGANAIQLRRLDLQRTIPY